METFVLQFLASIKCSFVLFIWLSCISRSFIHSDGISIYQILAELSYIKMGYLCIRYQENFHTFRWDIYVSDISRTFIHSDGISLNHNARDELLYTTFNDKWKYDLLFRNSPESYILKCTIFLQLQLNKMTCWGWPCAKIYYKRNIHNQIPMIKHLCGTQVLWTQLALNDELLRRV